MVRRWWALTALGLAMLVLGFDITILNVALPTLAADLGASTGEQQWVIDAFLVVFASCMLPAGLLGDRFGRRRMLVAGLAIMLVGSLAGALVGDPAALIAARAVMGLGAALVTPLAMAVLPTLFEPDERARAIAALTAALAAGMPLGPLLGGLLLDHFWWGSIFLINVPLIGVGTAACLLLLPESRDPAAPSLDPLSTLLGVGGLGLLVYGVIEAPARGWTEPVVLGALAGSLPLLTWLFLRDVRRPRPVLGLGLLAHRDFRSAALVGTVASLAMAGLLFLVPQYLGAIRGYDAFGTGLRLMPMMGGLLVAARTCQPLTRLLGPRATVAGGLGLLAFAGLLGATTDTDSGYGLTAAWLTVTGLGVGFALIPSMDAALGALPADRAGSGSGLLMTVRQVGSAVGVALLGSLLAQGYRDRLDTAGLPAEAADAARESVVAAQLVAERVGDPGLAEAADTAFLHGMGLALFATALVAGIGAVFGGLLLPGRSVAPPGDRDGQ
ncbi:MFS transporter [Streptomyces millisiae]|uniref:MFS transporter n=1 Tax=Streptomyces millisiae TaxID=3075542 RepID=A0ABU2LVJ1_9ACTN|nr:MFS transporter [Streptomyces sp. DSM 44918]MDT0321621.1 MFS transporter [Streptomyces sp. DSM 44918]